MTQKSQLTVRARFKEFCDSRQLTDFSNIVQVIHQDGSVFVFHNATPWFSDKQDDSDSSCESAPDHIFVGVSSEHNGDHLFYAGDLVGWWIL